MTDTTEPLLVHLRGRQDFKNAAWVETLEPRKREEVDFHNFERERDDAAVIEAQRATQVHANKKYYAVTTESQQYVEAWIKRHVRGRVFLDYACGNGRYAIEAARAGAAIAVGLDISDVSIKNARRAAEAAGVGDRCYFVQGDCEATELPDASIDVILCSGMLHHLDLQRAYPELHRILKPGGRILGAEALAHNPVIQLYRELTPDLRTEWEKRHILKQSDIDLATRWFRAGETRYWHLGALLAVPFRHWSVFRPLLRMLQAVDRAMLSIPGIRLMAWFVTFELILPEPPLERTALDR